MESNETMLSQTPPYPILGLLGNASLVFQHLPKCGGTSVHELLQAHFPPERVCPERFNELIYYPQARLDDYRYYSGHYDRNNVLFIPKPVRVITLLREPKERIISLYRFWRAHREESITEHHYAAKLAREMSLLQFLRHRADSVPENVNNYMTRYLSGYTELDPNGEFSHSPKKMLTQAAAHLDSMDCFGLLEYFEDFIHLLFQRLQLPIPDEMPRLKDHRRFTEDPGLDHVELAPISPEIQLELHKLTELDSCLYLYAKQRFLKLLAASGQRKALPRMSWSERTRNYGLRLRLQMARYV